MLETKKILTAIERQYRQANKEYNQKQQKKFKRECRKDFWLGASLFANAVIIFTLVMCIIGR